MSNNIDNLYKKINEINIVDTVKYTDIKKNIMDMIHEKQKKVIDIHHKKYTLLICDDDQMLKLFALYITIYANEQLLVNKHHQTKSYIGIDFEFNNRKIALMQINLESVWKLDHDNFIWILNPAEFDEKQRFQFIHKIMTNKDIYKILHGCDSLDIPYIYHELLNNNKDHIFEFTQRLIDTRFVCEYQQACINYTRKCSIYDSLLFFKVIDQHKYDELEKANDSMGPVYNISWNVKKLSSNQVNYAYYDVIYLKDLFFAILDSSKHDTPQYFNSYRYFSSFVRFVLLEKRGMIDISSMRATVDKMNNYLIKNKDENITLINIFTKVTEDLQIDQIGFNVKNLLNVNYLKSEFITLLKFIVYGVIKNKHKIYINKNSHMTDIINIQELYDVLTQHKFNKFKDFLEKIENHIENNLDRYI